jgi:hypothetical protein
MEATTTDFGSPGQLSRVHEFVLETLRIVKGALPPTVAETLDRIGVKPPLWNDSEKERVALWNSIAGDSMGKTPAGAATRAALFLFPHGDAVEHNADDVIWHFEMFYSKAGLPSEALASTFRRYWPG